MSYEAAVCNKCGAEEWDSTALATFSCRLCTSCQAGWVEQAWTNALFLRSAAVGHRLQAIAVVAKVLPRCRDDASALEAEMTALLDEQADLERAIYKFAKEWVKKGDD